ncbi:hypothetical protein EV421DRAFT_1741614 [Armillaria borealis]|uniref:Uncharacterized protein n=1 Tax=Armillaria borealis TaxID=47425 RepID=A0AA39IZQ1_9AGAR|nr:hypothetical protein EV421DRAFT_1741614 [Armillaria borealis]
MQRIGVLKITTPGALKKFSVECSDLGNILTGGTDSGGLKNSRGCLHKRRYIDASTESLSKRLGNGHTRKPALDEERDRSTFEGQEWMRAQQGEMSTGTTMQRYPDSLSGP